MAIYKLNTKNKYEGKVVSVDTKKKRGYKVKPKNKIKYDGIVVNEMFVIKPSFVEKIIKRKVSCKLDSYLQYIIKMLDDESCDASSTNVVLSDLNRYKEMINNNYKQYLDEKYVELLLKKVELLEYELKKKLMQLNAYNYMKTQESYMKDEEKEEIRRKGR